MHAFIIQGAVLPTCNRISHLNCCHLCYHEMLQFQMQYKTNLKYRPNMHSLTTFSTGYDKVWSERKGIFSSLQCWTGTRAEKHFLTSCHCLPLWPWNDYKRQRLPVGSLPYRHFHCRTDFQEILNMIRCWLQIFGCWSAYIKLKFHLPARSDLS